MNKHPSNVSETAGNKPTSNATAFTLPGTAVAPYRAFTAALSNGDTCPVHASNGTDWQDFIGTYSAGTLAQTTLLESSTGSWIDWSTGADVLLEIAWLGAAGEDTDAHLASTSNPHSVTAAQVGAYTSGAVDTLLTGKSDTSHNHSGVYEPADTDIQTHITDTALHSVGAQITAATGKATPVDADELGLVDSAASNTLKKLTWANLKATLTSIFALLAGKAGGQTLIGGSAVTDALVLQGTSGNGTLTSPAVHLNVGNNGGTVAMTALNNGNVGIGTTAPGTKLHVIGGGIITGGLDVVYNTLGTAPLLKAYRNESDYVFLQFGHFTSAVPSSSNTSFLFGGTPAQPHSIGSSTYLSGIWGGYDNELGDNTYASHIIGSNHSTITNTHNIIAGGSIHTINNSEYATILGGTTNTASGNYSLVAGGVNNNALASRATVIGNSTNFVYAQGAAVLGSSDSSIQDGATNAAIIGGTVNTIVNSGTYKGAAAAIIGGSNNTITNGDYSVILAGFQNSIGGRFASVLGGRLNVASGEYSLSAGRRAKATASGAFAFADSTDADFTVNTANKFGLRFSGGYELSGGNVGIGTTAPAHYLDITKSAENQRTVYGVNAAMTAATLQQDATATGSDQTLTNQYYAWPFTASASHTVGSWAVRLKAVGTITSTTAYVRLKIYSDNAGVPNTLLATTDVVRMGSLTSAYVSYLFGADLTLVSGTTYWIAVERSTVVTGGGSIAVDYNGTALTTATVAAPTSGDWTVNAGLGRYVVYGRSPLALYGSSTNNYGVYGSSTNNYGVYGSSTNNYGVYGISTNNYGVYGISTNNYGVYGISTNNIGVYGSSTNSNGVYGSSTNSNGVRGNSTNSYGVYGSSTNSYGVYGSSTNSNGAVFHQDGTLTSANAANTVLIRRYGVTNSTGSLNYSGNVLQITDNPTGTGTVSGALISGSVDGTTRLNFDPRVVDGASAVAYMLDTKNTLANATAKLFALRNGGVEKFAVLANGSVDINSDTLRVRTSRTPASATATGNAGDVCWDANYIYVCTATNTWKRSAISTW